MFNLLTAVPSGRVVHLGLVLGVRAVLRREEVHPAGHPEVQTDLTALKVAHPAFPRGDF